MTVKLEVGKYYRAKERLYAIPVGSVHLCVSNDGPRMLRVAGCGESNHTEFYIPSPTKYLERLSEEEEMIYKMAEET
jgi:hypothetical protein